MSLKWSRIILIACLTAMVWVASLDTALAFCPMCKVSLTGSLEGQRLANGFNRGILFLLSVPFLIVGTITLLILNARRQRAKTSGLRPPMKSEGLRVKSMPISHLRH